MSATKYILTGWFLFFNLISVHAYGTRTTEAPTRLPPPRYENDREQWGGVGPSHPGEYTSNNQRGSSNDRYSGNRNPGASQYERDGDEGPANYFAREMHVERYGVPDTCVHQPDPENICNYFVEIQKEPENPETLHFELSRHVSVEGGYVAMGFSKDKSMGEDLILECVLLADGTARVYHSWARAKTDPVRLNDDPALIQRDETYPRYENGVLTCKFRMPIVSTVYIEGKPTKFDFERGKFFVLLAAGGLRFPKSDRIGFHGNKPIEQEFAYVSPNLLGYSKETYSTRRHDEHISTNHFSSGSRGQQVSLKLGAVVLMFCLVREMIALFNSSTVFLFV